MSIWKKVAMGLLLAAAMGAGVCAVAGVNPASLLACDPSDPGCRR